MSMGGVILSVNRVYFCAIFYKHFRFCTCSFLCIRGNRTPGRFYAVYQRRILSKIFLLSFNSVNFTEEIFNCSAYLKPTQYERTKKVFCGNGVWYQNRFSNRKKIKS